MATQEDIGAISERESEIPMLTVVKNGAILKNIFLINSPDSHGEDSSKIPQDLEQALLVGRHPNCQIRLEHPSISRFHLRIHTKLSLKRLYVTDLQSVHGTWISGKRIEPNIRVELNEGDALIIGKSSRVYRLHWIAFQKASELNNPVIPPLDDRFPHKENDQEVKMDGNAPLLENHVESAKSPLRAMVSYPSVKSKEIKDVKVLICKNEDRNVLEIEGERSDDSASKGMVPITNQIGNFTELEDENAIVCKNVDTKQVYSTPETSESLPQSPNIKSLEAIKVLSVAPLLEARKDIDMQLLNLALEVLLDENPLSAELGDMDKEKEGNICESSTRFLMERVTGQIEENEVETSESLPQSPNIKSLEAINFLSVAPLIEARKDIDMQLLNLALEVLLDENPLSAELGDMDKEKEGNICESSTRFLMEQVTGQIEENEEYMAATLAECTTSSLPIEYINLETGNHQIVEDEGSLQDLILSENEEGPNWPALTSFPKDDVDCVKTALFVDDASYRNENQMPFSDEEDDGGWTFWSKCPEIATERNFINIDEETQGKEDENARKDDVDCVKTALFVDDASYRNENQMPFSDEEDEGGWTFWLNSPEIATERNFINIDEDTQGKEDENARKGDISKDPSVGVNESLLWSFWSGIPRAESSFSDAEVLSQIETQVINESSPNRADQSLCSRKGQSEIAGISIGNEDGLMNGERVESITRVLFNGVDHSEEECFTPNLSAYSNKENRTPKFSLKQKPTVQLSADHTKLSILTVGLAQRAPMQTLFADSPQKGITESHISGASMSAYSNKENQTPSWDSWHPSVEQKKNLMLVKREAQRTALKPLFSDSPCKSISETHISDSGLSVNCSKENRTPKQKSACHPSAECIKMMTNISCGTSLSTDSNRENLSSKFLQEKKSTSHSAKNNKQRSDTCDSGVLLRSRDLTNYESSTDTNKYSVGRAKRWTLVVDITCLLDKNSRKALQLLEGIRGTQLIIPMSVVRELEFMKQQASIFRRNTDAFLASQWIEECLVRTKWWIQIQKSKFTEDQVVDYALYLRGIRNDNQLIFLSVDTTKKIKAMEKGLICETAEEFRESVINPFSKRFLWGNSWPRGRTWSYLDDVILRDLFYPSCFKTVLKGAEESAKGLKLVLLD